ncbi:MAG: hypothetical protein F6K10_27825 [Moorea sp. SIO2B7]|nr:hypothetical protein [Moorena sp. SIO2B7]
MQVKGTFKNGVVQPIEPVQGREGQSVIITFVEETPTLQAQTDDLSWDDLLNFIAQYAVETGIEDLAHQHDHYLYGTAKKQPYS